jgi:D-alanyl-D-alanine carboxypeptidase
MAKRCVVSFRSAFAANRRAPLATACLALLPAVFVQPAAARSHHHHHYVRHDHNARQASSGSGGAAFVVDANSGHVLYARNENDLRHPASITKVMTLYLLFEQLEKGRFSLNSRLRISEHAAEQAPTKLGLDPGETIAVEDAIKAVVTKSANDIAVAIAESIGGDETTFADLMTRKAHALGMSRTLYRNASGLPNDEQVTTARDLALLGRAVQERFPQYYRYFATRTFYYGGEALKNHNHLLGRLDGVDGIKTGYTRASGFNLLTSVHRHGHHIVAVVLGGRTAGERDRIMAGLVEQTIGASATVQTASALAAPPVAAAPAAPEPPPRVASIASIAASAYVEPARLLPEPKGDKSSEPFGRLTAMERPRPAYVSGTPRTAEDHTIPTGSLAHAAAANGSTNMRTDGTKMLNAAQSTSTTPAVLRWVRGPESLANAPGRSGEETKIAAVPAAAARPAERVPPPAARPGLLIQVGATDDETKANALLARAKAQGPATLASAQGFTEKVQKGETTLYRARFTGLDTDSAEAACRSLKKSGIACLTLKN